MLTRADAGGILAEAQQRLPVVQFGLSPVWPSV